MSPLLLTAELAAAAAVVIARGAAATGPSGTVGGETGSGDWVDERGLLAAVVVVVGVGEVVVVADRRVLLTGIVTAVINWRFLLGTTGLVASGAAATPGSEAAAETGSAATGACGATISATVGEATMASVIGIVVVLDEGDDEAELDDDGGEGGCMDMEEKGFRRVLVEKERERECRGRESISLGMAGRREALFFCFAFTIL